MFGSNTQPKRFGARGTSMQNWKCPKCGAMSRYYWNVCSNCGANKPKG